MRLSRERIDLDALAPAPKEALFDELHAVCASIFDGYPRLAVARGYRFDDPPSPYVRLSTERSLETAEEHRSWRQLDQPAVKFYLATNPRYAEGRGLIRLVPLTIHNVFGITRRYLAQRARSGRAAG